MLYIQHIKDRPIDKQLNSDEKDLNKIDQCVHQFGDINILIADDTEVLPIPKVIIYFFVSLLTT